MRRLGALFVYDPEHRIRERILNPESVIFAGWKPDANAENCSGQSLIGPSIENVAIGKGLGSLKSKRRLIELACVDGAVVFDDNHLLAVGASSDPIRALAINWGPGHGSPFCVSLGSASDQGELGRRRHLVLPEHQ